MRRPSKHFWMAFGVAVLVLIALGFLRHAVVQIGFHRQQMENRRQELAELRQLRAQMASPRAAYEWVQAARNGDRLNTLVKRHLPELKTDLVVRETRPAGEGWSEQRYDLRIDAMAPDKLGPFLVACENARPPVRLREIQVSVSAESRLVVAQLSLAELVPPAASGQR